ncbi:helix-turn-helix transcriptional regulator [Scandinavium manionii]|uniref:helix-turn-helix transcriptional regulator n=1 Tax=Scandinavium manionii TaxID=2926520 RepID=UPI0013590C98|nr:LuxR C-terminal-related transcriptional regulator [Scandinavium manionii]MCS2149278.1 LuxR C-terminal-related transcriptional regulator [Scandinavium manionii]MCS2165282.1 LuxR C-terminal-related transcriptional regulator [Scandinavium manionii]
MLTVFNRCGVMISNVPIIQAGLLSIMKDNFPEYEVSCHHHVDELTIIQLQRTSLIVCDLSGDRFQVKALCEKYYSLMTQYRECRWIFMLNQANYALAVEYLLRPESILLSDAESIPELIAAIRDQGSQANRISTSLMSLEATPALSPQGLKTSLSLAERQALRLLAKGWGVNQIAMLLRKSNRTISAQKNSAMRRLSLRGNAELYAWLNSEQGMKELNLLSVWGEPMPWKSAPQINTSLSLKTV